MLYLKGTQGRRFIADDGNDSDLFEKIDIETRSQNTNPLTLSEATAVLLASIRQAQQEEENEESARQYFWQENPNWRKLLF
ncbi:spexin prohormone 1 [Carcharodon carcharias]|uniref:spexin prohormone 1 n=1 Tax=Carcharodon carcharias TaxID=13397 RepID=UPI001B7E8DEB|nr:spexin prohormone 1 [Carcharodon carcharias]